MVHDLNFPVQILGIETQRESDGLAMSSRNVYLNGEERKAATCLWKALNGAKIGAENEGMNLPKAMAKAMEIFEREKMAKLDYLIAVEKNTFMELEGQNERMEFNGEAILLIAAFIGTTRLIDNIELNIGAGRSI
jgi:pantoate--beta-alanine ligase